MDSFFQAGPASPPYEAVRDTYHLAGIRALIEHLWADYRPPSDPHFLEDAKQHFHQRTWELYLWHVLKKYGHAPQKSGSIGPDFFFLSGEGKVWVEAVAPGRGSGPDAVPKLRTINEMLDSGEEPIAQQVPEEAIILRFTHAMREKLKKYEAYRSKGIVQSEDRFIIAINGCEATDYRGEPSVPYLIKAAIALGHLQISFDPAGVELSRGSYQRRELIRKKNQELVTTDLFLRNEYRSVSTVLYSPKDICNIPESVGSEMYYFHNPLAVNPLSPGIFRFCREYRADLEEGMLDCQDWHLE